MAKFRDILNYYRPYLIAILVLQQLASLKLLICSYVIGQILNVLSGQPVDSVMLWRLLA